MAGPEELVLVEAVLQGEASAQHRPRRGRHEEEGGGAGEDQTGAGENGEDAQGTGRAERRSAAGQERPLSAAAG